MSAAGRQQLAGAMPAARPWLAPLAVLGLGLAVLGGLFFTEIAAAIDTWERSSAYNHCWLVLPLAVWLGWTRRALLDSVAVRPAWWLALPALGGALVWFAMERLGIMEGRQFAALGIVWVLALAVLGWRVCWVMAGPLAYLIFLVPFGEFATPWLQDATLWMIVLGLRLLGISHHVDGLLIETPSGVFLVAEACAGLRFMIAALAFGGLYALVMFRSPWRRLAVMGLAVVVPLVANGLRALGIVLLGQYLGSAEAAAADHVIYGWVFFSAVLVLLVLAGLPFRQDEAVAGARPRPTAMAPRDLPRPSAAALAGLLVVALAALGPVAAGRLNAGVAAAVPEPAALAAPAGCRIEGMGLRCGATRVTAALITFAPGANWSSVAAARRQALSDGDDEAVVFRVDAPGMAWQARQSGERPGVLAAGTWLDGVAVGDGLRTRAAQAWNGLRGTGGRPVLAVVTLAGAEGVARDDERRVLRAVRAAQRDGRGAVAARHPLIQHVPAGPDTLPRGAAR